MREVSGEPEDAGGQWRGDALYKREHRLAVVGGGVEQRGEAIGIDRAKEIGERAMSISGSERLEEDLRGGAIALTEAKRDRLEIVRKSANELVIGRPEGVEFMTEKTVPKIVRVVEGELVDTATVAVLEIVGLFQRIGIEGSNGFVIGASHDIGAWKRVKVDGERPREGGGGIVNEQVKQYANGIVPFQGESVVFEPDLVATARRGAGNRTGKELTSERSTE